jgi:hypothetical protein
VGVMKELVLLPVAPVRFTTWVMDKVAQDVDHRLNSPEARIQRLREIEEARERGELHEDHAAELEAQIIEEATAPSTVGSPTTTIETEEGAQDDRRR